MLRRCLEGIRGQVRPPDELRVVDSSDDGTAECLRELSPEAEVVHVSSRLLPGAARNLGAEATSADVVAFIDSDCVASPNWLEELDRELEAHPESPGATARLCGPPDENLFASMDRILHTSAVLALNEGGTTTRASTSNLAVRRSAFIDAGGLAADVLGNEDHLLCRVLVAKHGPFRVAKRAWVAHLSQDTLEAVLFHQRRFGRVFVDGRRADPSLDGAWAVRRPWLIPVLPVGRSLLLIRRLARHDRAGLWTVLRHPILFARLMLAWTHGVWEAVRGETSHQWDLGKHSVGGDGSVAKSE